MKELVCYLLARAGGNANPSKDDVKAILSSVAIEADDAKLDALFKDLENLDVDAAIKEGMEQLAIIPSGGGGGGGGGAAAAGGDGAAAGGGDAAVDDEDEESSKSSEAGGGNLFGGGGDDSSDEDSSSG